MKRKDIATRLIGLMLVATVGSLIIGVVQPRAFAMMLGEEPTTPVSGAIKVYLPVVSAPLRLTDAAELVTAAAIPIDTSALRTAVTVDGVRAHQAALQAIADANSGVRASGTPGYCLLYTSDAADEL